MPDIEAIRKTVFFVTRIGDEGSPARLRSNDVMDYLLKPVVHEIDPSLKVVRADAFPQLGRITDRIFHHLLYSAVIVADTTDLNPNVMYEVGVAHAFRRPVVLITSDPKTIPFDTKAEAHILLPGDGPLGARVVDEHWSRLKEALTEAMSDSPPAGPVAMAEAQLTPTNLSTEEATTLLRETVLDLVERVGYLEDRSSFQIRSDESAMQRALPSIRPAFVFEQSVDDNYARAIMTLVASSPMPVERVDVKSDGISLRTSSRARPWEKVEALGNTEHVLYRLAKVLRLPDDVAFEIIRTAGY